MRSSSNNVALLVYALVVLGINAAIIYTVIHFVAKYW